MSKIELIRQNLHRSRYKSQASTQITLDDDFIVPDAMDDMEKIIVNSGDVILDSVRNQTERVMIRGKLAFQVLYRNPEGGLQTLAGSIAIEEPMNVPGLEEKDETGVSWELEDLSTEMINSRKLNVKAILTFRVRSEALMDGEAVVEAREAGSGNMEALEDSPLQVRRQMMETAALKVRRKDTVRVRESITLPGNKPAMEQILWKQVSLLATSAKSQDGSLLAEGQIQIFCLYEGEGEELPVQWFEETIPFSGTIELDQISEGMPSFTRMRLVHKELEAKPDADGELRELDLDAVVELDIKIYEEEPLELVEDLCNGQFFDWQDRGGAIDCQIGELPGAVQVDSEYMQRVMDNLLSNLKKYGDPAYPLQIQIDEHQDMLHILLKNHVLEQKNQIESTQIGLKTCRRIIENHGGTFAWRTDTQKNTFTIEMELPLAKG